MNSPACKYSQLGYWEWTLEKQDVWNNLFVPPEQLSSPVFVNACVIDDRRVLLDSNWACYPDSESVLGFMQYIFLPTVFYYAMNPETDHLVTPIVSTPEFLELIQKIDTPHRLAMSGFVYELCAVWKHTGQKQWDALLRFCARFNQYWKEQGFLFCLNIFSGAEEVASYLKELVWCEELFEEEFGYSFQQLDELCQRFEEEPFAKHLLLHWLNTRVGTLE